MIQNEGMPIKINEFLLCSSCFDVVVVVVVLDINVKDTVDCMIQLVSYYHLF